MLSKKSWSYLQILQDTNTHTFGFEVSYAKTVSLSGSETADFSWNTRRWLCLHLLLSPHNVELLEEEEPRHVIHWVFLWSVPLFTGEMEKSLLVVIPLPFKVQNSFYDHWCIEHILCMFSPPGCPLSPLAPSCPAHQVRSRFLYLSQIITSWDSALSWAGSTSHSALLSPPYFVHRNWVEVTY